MPQAKLTIAFSYGDVAIKQDVMVPGDHPQAYQVTLPVGSAGTLGTRTDADTGVANVGAGHGLATNDVVDVRWDGGRRYGMIATVATNAITIDGGAGDNLPVTTTALVVTKRVQINTAIDGDAVQVIVVSAEFVDPNSTAKAQLTLKDSGAAVIRHIDLAANVPDSVQVAAGQSNPYTGNPITVGYASNGSSSEVCTLKIVSMEDSTP